MSKETKHNGVNQLLSGIIGVFAEDTTKPQSTQLKNSQSEKNLSQKTIERKDTKDLSQKPLEKKDSKEFKDPLPRPSSYLKTEKVDYTPERKSLEIHHVKTNSVDKDIQKDKSFTMGRTSLDQPRPGSLDYSRAPDPPQPKQLFPYKGVTNGIKFEGYMDENKKFSGRCRLQYPNGDEYEGGFLNHKMHGYAVCKYAFEEIVFTGDWRFNRVKQDSLGVISYLKTGDKYYGNVKNAEFVNNSLLIKVMRNGQGECHYSNGQKYYGTWKNDLKNGYGLMEYPNSEKYYGNWEDDKRSGFGVLIYKDGTVYEGEWKKDEKNGNARMTLCNGDIILGQWNNNSIKNASYKKGEINETSRCTRLLLREQIQKINVAKMNFSLTNQSDLTGDKWSGLLLGYKFIDQLQSELYKKNEKGIIKRDVTIEELMNSKSVITITEEFVNMFNWKYYNTGNEANILLPQALDDFMGFFYQLHQNVLRAIGEQQNLKISIHNELKNFIITKIYKIVIGLYQKIYKEQDSIYKYKLLSLSNIKMTDLGVHKKLQLDYSNAIQVFKTLSDKENPNDKFDILVQVSDEIMKMITVENIGGADDLFPVFLYIFIIARIPNVYSEFQFLTDFLDEVVSKTQKYYRFNNLEMAIQYIKLLDYNIRDENNVLVPILFFEERLEKAVFDVLKEHQREKKQAPKLMWLCRLFVELGNCKEKNKYLCDFKEISKQFESTKTILKSAGLTLMKEGEDYFILFDFSYPSNFYFKMANVLETILHKV